MKVRQVSPPRSGVPGLRAVCLHFQQPGTQVGTARQSRRAGEGAAAVALRMRVQSEKKNISPL
jgi:hypothetical protein